MPLDTELVVHQSSEKDDRYHVPSLVRALSIIEHLAEHREELGSAEIADALAIPRNSVFRILTTLTDYGYAHRDPENKTYGLSRKFLSVAYRAIDGQNLVERSLDQLRSLRDLTGETVLIGALTGHEGIVIEQVLSKHTIKVMVDIGQRFTMHTAAPAKAMLAFLPPAERDAAVSRITFTRFTDSTCTSAAAFLEELKVVAETGYALDRGEEVADIVCIAAPIFNHRRRPIASIWVTGPKSRVADHDIDPIRRATMLHARRISARLGYDSPELPVPQAS